jgi:metal-sulfur cluster biosynthetic enzyme
MSEDLTNKVREAVSKVNDPHMGVSIVEMGIVQNIDIDGSTAKITIKPTNPGCMSVARMAADAKAQALSVDGIDDTEIIVEGHAMADSINEMINKKKNS